MDVAAGVSVAAVLVAQVLLWMWQMGLDKRGETVYIWVTRGVNL